jgi:hypothetical protein
MSRAPDSTPLIRECACGCGEKFQPYRPNHVYVEDHRHRKRGRLMRLKASHLRALRDATNRILAEAGYPEGEGLDES